MTIDTEQSALVGSVVASETFRNSATGASPSEYGPAVAGQENPRRLHRLGFFCVEPTSRADRDCVGAPVRCCARTKDFPAREGKRTALTGVAVWIRTHGAVDYLLGSASWRIGDQPSTCRGICPLYSVQGFSFSFDRLFPQLWLYNFHKRGGIFGGRLGAMKCA